MGTNSTPGAIRGFLQPIDFTTENIWESQSTYTIQNPIPGHPASGGDYDLGLTATGEYTEATPIRIQTNRPGHIGQAGFVWRETGETDYFGADTAAAVARWKSIINGNSTSQVRTVLDSISNPDGSCTFLFEYASGTTRTIAAGYLNRSQSLSTSTIYSQNLASPPLQGCLCKLEDGSIIAIYLQANTAEGRANVRTSRSFDNGLNWFEISRRALPLDIDVGGTFGAGNTGADIYRLSAASARGEILLAIATRAHNTSLAYQDILEQYSSTDGGGNFVHIGNTGTGESYYQPNIIAVDNQFYLIGIESVDSAIIVEIENSTEPIQKARGFGRVEITNELIATFNSDGYLDEGQCSAWVDENNRVYVAFQRKPGDAGNDFFFIVQSDNPMKQTEWFHLGNDNSTANRASKAQFFNSGDSASRPNNIRGCGTRGTQYIIHDYVTSSSTLDNGIHLLELGGYSTVNLPQLVEYPADYQFSNWSINWLPYDKPDDLSNWTKYGTGNITAAASHALFESLNVATVFVESSFFTTSTDEGIIIRSRCQPITEGGTNRGRGIYAQTTTRRVSVYIDTGNLYLYDEEGATQLASATVDTTGGIEIILAMNTTARAWYRQTGEINKRWVPLGNGSLAAGTNPNNLVRFGHLTALDVSAGDQETQWFEFHYSYGYRTGYQLADGQENPEELVSKLYPPQGLTTYITGGTRISTFDGAAFQGEHYTISEDSQHPLRRAIFENSPTPRTTWRSENDNTLQTLAFYWDVENADSENMHLGTDSIAIHLANLNFYSFTIEEYNAAGASWGTPITITNQLEGLKNFSRQGNSLTCTDSTGIFIHENECIGHYLFIENGGTDIVRKITRNTAGILGTSTSTKKAVFTLQDADPGDPTTFTGRIIPNNCTVIIHQRGTRSAGFRIKIPAQDTQQGYFQIGTILAGALHISQQYSRGRTQTFTSGTFKTELQDGQTRTKKAHDGIRNIRISWAEGIDTSQLFETNPSPDYYEGTTAANAEPIATPAATPSNIFGLARIANEALPLVYIPKITISSNTHELINRYHKAILCRINSDVSIENVLGDEDSNPGEIFRVANMVLKEII